MTSNPYQVVVDWLESLEGEWWSWKKHGQNDLIIGLLSLKDDQDDLVDVLWGFGFDNKLTEYVARI